MFNNPIFGVILNNPIIGKLMELFNLLLTLADRILILFERLGLWIWDVFGGVFATVLQFTIDFVNLILSYI